MPSNLHAERDITSEVRAALGRRRKSQAALASALGLSQAAVSRRLTGAVDFSVTELRTVAEFLDVDVIELLEPAGARSGSAS